MCGSNKKFFRFVFFLVTLILLVQIFNPHPFLICQKKEIVLKEILSACVQYCDKLKEARLDFTCVEEIEEIIFSPINTISSYSFRPFKRQQKKYVYDYQLMKEGKTITERRILLKENGKDKYDEDAKLKTQQFDYKFVINGPIGVIDRDWQKNFDYKIIGNEEINEKMTVVLEAIPKSPTTIDHLFGRIWIDLDDFGIMKIEWNQKSLGNYEAVEKTAKMLNAVPHIKLCSEYFYEKNGIRFPSKYTIEEMYKSGLRVLTKSKLTVNYEDYKFFTVETSVKYDDDL